MKILVATDGSKAGEAAVRFASRLAAGPGARLLVVSVDPVDSAPTEPAAPGGRSRARDAKRVLEAAARQLRGRAARFLRIVSPGDEIPEAIAREADRVRADLVVVGSEGRDSLQEWVVGGTALRLIYVARRPVTVVRAPRLLRAR